MPDNHEARLHIEYDVLYVADLRTMLRLFEVAYNILQPPSPQSNCAAKIDCLFRP